MSDIELKSTPDASDEIPPVTTYYGAGFGIFSTLMDFTLQFSSRRPTGSTTPLCEIILSPPHAKLIALLLAKQLTAYEVAYGQINIPAAVYTKLGLVPPEHE